MARDQSRPVNESGQVSASDLRSMAEQAAQAAGSYTGSAGFLLLPGGMLSTSTDMAGPAGGDLSGYYPDPTVVALQGNSVADTAPSDGQVLTWSAGSSEWQPASVAAGSITVQEPDLSPSYTGISTIQLDNTQGGVLTQPASGKVLISWADASPSTPGVVSTGTQTIGGDKTFQDTARHEDTVYYQMGNSFVNSTNLEAYLDATEIDVWLTWGLTWTIDAYGGLLAGDKAYMTFKLATGSGVGVSSEDLVLDISDNSSNFGLNRVYFSVARTRGVWGTYGGMNFYGGILVGGSFTAVTSVNASGGSTGLSFSGGPITSSGTLTLGGTLATANGGTGLTSTPPAGTILTGTGSGYTQTPAHILTAKWTLTV